MTSCKSHEETGGVDWRERVLLVSANLPKKVHFPCAGETVAFDTTWDLHFEDQGLQRHDWRWHGHVERTRHSRLFDRIPIPLRRTWEGNRGARLANSALCAAGAGGDDRYRGASGRARISSRREASADAFASGGGWNREILRTRRAPEGSSEAEACGFVWKPGLWTVSGRMSANRHSRANSRQPVAVTIQEAFTLLKAARPLSKNGSRRTARLFQTTQTLRASRPSRDSSPEGRPSTDRRSSIARLSPGGEVGTRLSALRRFALRPGPEGSHVRSLPKELRPIPPPSRIEILATPVRE